MYRVAVVALSATLNIEFIYLECERARAQAHVMHFARLGWNGGGASFHLSFASD